MPALAHDGGELCGLVEVSGDQLDQRAADRMEEAIRGEFAHFNRATRMTNLWGPTDFGILPECFASWQPFTHHALQLHPSGGAGDHANTLDIDFVHKGLAWAVGANIYDNVEIIGDFVLHDVPVEYVIAVVKDNTPGFRWLTENCEVKTTYVLEALRAWRQQPTLQPAPLPPVFAPYMMSYEAAISPPDRQLVVTHLCHRTVGDHSRFNFQATTFTTPAPGPASMSVGRPIMYFAAQVPVVPYVLNRVQVGSHLVVVRPGCEQLAEEAGGTCLATVAFDGPVLITQDEYAKMGDKQYDLDVYTDLFAYGGKARLHLSMIKAWAHLSWAGPKDAAVSHRNVHRVQGDALRQEIAGLREEVARLREIFVGPGHVVQRKWRDFRFTTATKDAIRQIKRTNPKAGPASIHRILVDQGIVDTTPESIKKFLQRERRSTRAAVDDCVGQDASVAVDQTPVSRRDPGRTPGNKSRYSSSSTPGTSPGTTTQSQVYTGVKKQWRVKQPDFSVATPVSPGAESHNVENPVREAVQKA